MITKLEQCKTRLQEIDNILYTVQTYPTQARYKAASHHVSIAKSYLSYVIYTLEQVSNPDWTQEYLSYHATRNIQSTHNNNHTMNANINT